MTNNIEGCYLYYVKNETSYFQKLNTFDRAPIYYKRDQIPVCRNSTLNPISTQMKN
jgi:hypothetical protein